MRVWLALILCVVLAPGARADCRLALVLALDVSASVDVNEYRLQMSGTAAALTSPRVRSALLGPGSVPVSIAVFVWSGPDDQALVSDWVAVDSEAALQRLAAEVDGHARKIVFDGRTAIGSALIYAEALLARGPVCARRVIDVAADGETNAGAEPEAVPLADITVNALAVTGNQLMDHGDAATEEGPLTRYLRQSVIRGPDAFVELAEDYRDFEAAMTRKLERELDGRVFSDAGPAAGLRMRKRR